jgi:preprotein translocase subunit YajC
VDKLLPVLPFVGIALLFWFLLVRPTQGRQRELARLQGGLAVGDEVMLTSGIFGSVRAVDEQSISLEVAEGVTLKVVRAAVGRVVTSAGEFPGTRVEEAGLADYTADEPEEK